VEDRALNVAVWADASASAGAGHIMRCLALAEALRIAGARVDFFGCVHIDDVASAITERGFELTRLSLPVESGASELRTHLDRRSEPMDWLVVDSYGADAGEEASLRPSVERIAVIDDLANRPHDCDLLLDQNLAEDSKRRYDSLVPASAVQLLGPRFALLRSEFWDSSALLRPRDGAIRRVLVTFGGTDPTHETLKTLEALERLRTPIAVDVILGCTDGEYHARVTEAVKRLPDARLYGYVANMAELMASVDLVVGAGGSTTWERCALALPSVTTVVAPNQMEATAMVAQRGATVNLGWFEDVDAQTIASAVERLLDSPDEVKAISEAAAAVVGGRSDGARVVASMMITLNSPADACQLRAMGPDDARQVLQWRNDDRVRLAMTDQHIISPAEHADWFAQIQADPSQHHYVFECAGTPLGVMNLKSLDSDGLIEWGFYLGERWAPRGSGAVMGKLGLRTAFTSLGAREVRGRVVDTNLASLRLHEKLGFDRLPVSQQDASREVGFRITRAKWTSMDERTLRNGAD